MPKKRLSKSSADRVATAPSIPVKRPAAVANPAPSWRARFIERRRLEDLRHAIARAIRRTRATGDELDDGVELRKLGNQLLDIVRDLEHRAWS